MDIQPLNQSPKEKLTNLASEAAEVEKTSGGFMNPGAKRKRGRPQGSQSKVGAGPQLTGSQSISPGQTSSPAPGIDLVTKWIPWSTMYTEMLSNLCIQVAEDEKAKIIEPQKTLLIQSGAQVGADFLGDVGSKWMNLTAFLGVSALAGFAAYKLRSENLEKLRAEKRNHMNGVSTN